MQTNANKQKKKKQKKKDIHATTTHRKFNNQPCLHMTKNFPGHQFLSPHCSVILQHQVFNHTQTSIILVRFIILYAIKLNFNIHIFSIFFSLSTTYTILIPLSNCIARIIVIFFCFL